MSVIGSSRQSKLNELDFVGLPAASVVFVNPLGNTS